MSKITAQPARTFLKAYQAGRASGEKSRNLTSEGGSLSQRSLPSGFKPLCHQQKVNMTISFNQHWDATSLIKKKVARVYNLIFQALPFGFILTWSVKAVVRWLWAQRNSQTVPLKHPQLDTTHFFYLQSFTEVNGILTTRAFQQGKE